MHHSTIGVLITTINTNVAKVKEDLLPQLKDVDEVIVCHQIFEAGISSENKEEIEKLHKNLTYRCFYEQGSSKNRNNALKLATADILYFCDDDIDVLPGFIEKIQKAYQVYPQADIISFESCDENGKKHYELSSGAYSYKHILRVYLLGITVKRKSIEEKNIFFDEDFGLGTEKIIGEENIFLREAQKLDLRLYHIGQILVQHPLSSTGVVYNEQLIQSRMLLFTKLYGFCFSFLAVFYILVSHYQFYKSFCNPFQFFFKNIYYLCKQNSFVGKK